MYQTIHGFVIQRYTIFTISTLLHVLICGKLHFVQSVRIIILMEKSEVNEPVISRDSLETKWRLSASSHKKSLAGKSQINPVLVKKN